MKNQLDQNGYINVMVMGLFLKYPLQHNGFQVELDDLIICNLKKIAKNVIDWNYVMENLPIVLEQNVSEYYDVSIFFESCKEYLKEHNWISSFGNILWIHYTHSYLYNRVTKTLLKFDWQNNGELLLDIPEDISNILIDFEKGISDEDLYFHHLMKS